MTRPRNGKKDAKTLEHGSLPSWCDSGLVSVQESHRIGLTNGTKFTSIGLIENGTVGRDIPVLKHNEDLEKSSP